MSLADLGWMVFVNGLAQLAGLLVLVLLAVRGLRAMADLSRMVRAVAGLVIQEEERTRGLIQELLRREAGGA
jgi:hypothetical protein